VAATLGWSEASRDEFVRQLGVTPGGPLGRWRVWGEPGSGPPLRASKAALALAACHLEVPPCCWQPRSVWPRCRCCRAAEQMRATLADLNLGEGDVAAALGPLGRDGAAGLDWNALMASNPGSLQVRAAGARVCQLASAERAAGEERPSSDARAGLVPLQEAVRRRMPSLGDHESAADSSGEGSARGASGFGDSSES
jgi:hypothetical protein